MFSDKSTKPEQNMLISRMEYSRIQITWKSTDERPSEFIISEKKSFGFLLHDNNHDSVYIILPLHGIEDTNISDIVIKSPYLKNFKTVNYSSFIKSQLLDIALCTVNWDSIIIPNLLRISDIDFLKKDEKFLFNFYSPYLNNINHIKHANNVVDYYNSSTSGLTIIYKSCILNTHKENQVLLTLCNGLSGLLSYTKSNKLHSVFIGTTNDKFLFLPMYYIRHLINLVENKRYNGFSHLPIKVTSDNMNNLKSIQKYDTIEYDDIIVAIDNLEIDKTGQIYIKEYKSKLFFDDYVLLHCNENCSLTIIRNFKKHDITVSCNKVK